MALAISAMAPNCLPSLHGPSRLSRASSAAAVPPPPPPLFAEDYSQKTTLFTDEEFGALMRGHCDLLSFSEEHLHSRLLFSDETLPLQAQLFHLQTPPLSLDSVLHAPISEDDVDLLAPMFSDEEIQVICAAQQASELSSAGSRSDEQAGEKRKSPPWTSCISDDEDEDDDMEEAGPPSPPPPPPVKRARARSRRRREEDYARAALLQLREWHGTIAARILRRQFRAPELSHGRTALGCRCLELSMADDGGACALHQDARPGADRAWMCSAKGHVPLVGGPGEVLVPTTAAGNSKATVQQYARWRRSVWMPTRFYVQGAAQQGMAAGGRLDDALSTRATNDILHGESCRYVV